MHAKVFRLNNLAASLHKLD